MKPISAVPSYVATSGVAGAGCAWAIICILRPPILLAQIMFLLGCALPMWALELRRHKSPNAYLQPSLKMPLRRRLRLLGLLILLALFCATISVFRAFSGGALSGLDDQFCVLVGCGVLWMLWMYMRRPQSRQFDSVESLGSAFTHYLKNRKVVESGRKMLLGWIVKAFYLPLMFSSSLVFLYTATLDLSVSHGWWKVFSTIYFSLFAVDTAFAAIGYCSTSGRIDAHIRSTDSSLLGWFAALICYPPLSELILVRWFTYQEAYDWRHWFSGMPILLFCWGCAILMATGLYVWATISFGPRFSNLTNRGIITSGPYAYFKHPSYIGKNLAWWLISIPLLSQGGWIVALIHTLSLLTINGIYVLRAKTEERHLLTDPAYQAYSAWIEEFGVFAKLRRLIRRHVRGWFIAFRAA